MQVRMKQQLVIIALLLTAFIAVATTNHASAAGRSECAGGNARAAADFNHTLNRTMFTVHKTVSALCYVEHLPAVYINYICKTMSKANCGAFTR